MGKKQSKKYLTTLFVMPFKFFIFVNEKKGILTKQTIEEYAKGLIAIQKDYSTYNRQTIQQDANLKFSEEVIYEKLEKDYFSSLLNVCHLKTKQSKFY
jgi:hypothetical protein